MKCRVPSFQACVVSPFKSIDFQTLITTLCLCAERKNFVNKNSPILITQGILYLAVVVTNIIIFLYILKGLKNTITLKATSAP